MAITDSTGRSALKRLLPGALASIITFLVYIPALSNGFINWDDGSYVYDNLRIRSAGLDLLKWAFISPVSSNWHPLTVLSYALDYRLFGLEPFGYHLENVIIHAVNTLLVGILALRFAGGGARGMAASFTAAALFGIHPVHVESVAWVSERKDVLSTLFSLLAVLSYLRYAESGRLKAYALTAALFVLAILSKPMAVTLPLVFLVLDCWPLKRFALDFKRAAIEKLPLFAVSGAAALLTVWAQKAGGAVVSLETFPLWVRIWTAVRGFVFYLLKMAWPSNLAPYYPHPEAVTVLAPEFGGALAVLIAITAFCAYMTRRTGAFASAWAVYVITLLPVIGIIQVGGQGAADRYTYIPSIPLFMLVGSGLGIVIERKGVGRYAAAASAIMALAVLCALTLRQIPVWKDGITFWSYEIEKHPEKVWIAYINRGLAYEDAGRHASALEDFSKGISLKPGYADNYVNRGNVYNFLKEYGKAIEDFNTALRLKPGSIEAYNNRGMSLRALGDLKGAEGDFMKALSLNPGEGAAYYNLSLVYADMGEDMLAYEMRGRAAALGYR